MYTSNLYRTCKNAASSFKTHLRASHLSMHGNGVISGREPLIMQPVGQGRILYTQPLHIMYHGNSVMKTVVAFLDLLVSPHRRGWPGGQPKTSFVWGATQKLIPKRHSRGCGGQRIVRPRSCGVSLWWLRPGGAQRYTVVILVVTKSPEVIVALR